MQEPAPQTALNAEQRAMLQEILRGALDGMTLLTAENELKAYECDALTVFTRPPLAVALPETEAQVQAVLQTCSGLGIPVTVRGAGTGLTGSGTATPDGLLLAMARFNRILKIDPQARTATVEPGVRNQAVSDAAAPYGLFYAPDPSSQLACTIGGNIAQNAGGLHCLKYGLTTHNVLKIRAVLMDGSIIELGGEAYDAPGLDLLPLFIGSEGMFAAVTEVVLKLLPKPQTAQVIQASFADMGKAGRAVADIIAEGIIPAGLEMMDGASTRAVDDYLHAGFDREAEALLLCESDGMAEEVEAEIGKIRHILSRAGATGLKVSRNEIERTAIWAGRKSVFPAAARLAPDSYCMDGTIPRRKIGEMLDFTDGLSKKYRLQCINVFHAGDGNMHPLILFDNQAGEWPRAEAFGAEILRRCVQLGGTITGEHGVGLEKIDGMCAQFGEGERAAFWGIKAAFDPEMLLNRDKKLPLKTRCAEYARTFDGGSIAAKFPDLEYF